MSHRATVEAQVICPAVLSFLGGKFAPFLCQASSWLHYGYLDLGFIFDFLNMWVLVVTPISPRGALSSSGDPRGPSKNLPVMVKFLGLFH